jgi:hypothetical protein
MNTQQSEGHISFINEFEYFWLKEATGKRIVVKASISNPLDPSTRQRIGARFEGTESWFSHFGSLLTTPAPEYSFDP